MPRTLIGPRHRPQWPTRLTVPRSELQRAGGMHRQPADPDQVLTSPRPDVFRRSELATRYPVRWCFTGGGHGRASGSSSRLPSVVRRTGCVDTVTQGKLRGLAAQAGGKALSKWGAQCA